MARYDYPLIAASTAKVMTHDPGEPGGKPPDPRHKLPEEQEY